MANLILVRHGQASFGEAVYDKLSSLGERQSHLLGGWLRQCGVVPDLVATGGMRRQVDTARFCLAETGSPAEAAWQHLDGLGEYDHDTIVARFRPDYADPVFMRDDLARTGNPRRAFHAMYVEAVARWIGAAHDADYTETWGAFRERVRAGLHALMRSDARTVVGFTSGGPIMIAVQHLLGIPDSKAFDVNWPLVNAGMTHLRFSATTGAASLVTYNSYPHLTQAGDPALVTFR